MFSGLHFHLIFYSSPEKSKNKRQAKKKMLPFFKTLNPFQKIFGPPKKIPEKGLLARVLK